MYDPDKGYSFRLMQASDEGNQTTELAIRLHVDDRTVEVRNIIPDGALEYVDLDD